MESMVDAVVVGAGHNGLVAANLLVDAGWDVVVLEGTPHIGGAVRSAEVTAPGYLSDLCSAFYPLTPLSPAIRHLALGDHGLEWTHAPAVLAHLLEDGRAAVLSRDLDATAASLDSFAKGDGDRWRSLYREWLTVVDDLIPAMLTPFPPVRAAARLLTRNSVADTVRLARRFVLPTRLFGDRTFGGDGARVLIAGLALHTDLSPDGSASAGYGWLLGMLGQQVGFPVPVGGAQKITDALASRLLANGGAIETNALVTSVVVGNGTALGVRLADGRAIRARRAVLADVPAPTLYRTLVGAGHLPERLLDDLDLFQWDDATLKVDWALSAPVPWINPDVATAGTVHLGADVDGLTRYSTDITLGRTPHDPFLLVGQMNTSDPGRSPAGTESLWAYTHLPHRDRWDPAEIAAHAERIEDVLERHAPGFRSLVVGRYVAGPPQLEEKNLSLVDGAINGGTAGVHQQLFLRPVPGLGRADTPVDRLYLASASAHPGGGVHGAPGANAARAALARHRPVLGGAYGSLVRSLNRAIYG
ncbi:FAD-dependent oxidoreductase [Virgisporangium ochraceum]|uniref:Pyridine nucleotide-disulfide oxidoreductase domain-containing protein 2 n=2 Tax=Virgisporangium ochraceum TaxID=65505 RepID=A0A8J4EB45_9ACTN|nr:FAD-dependent oxidoreductase [Virgisporangium ochraceum]